MVSLMKIERTKREITQIDLWMKTGIPQWKISLIERGLIPTEEEAKRIACILEMEVDELFPGVHRNHRKLGACMVG